jgi:hypothetical protein
MISKFVSCFVVGALSATLALTSKSETTKMAVSRDS